MRTWLACLCGRREAIRELASGRTAVPAGLLFLLTAGLAREYDRTYLLREPGHLLVPFVVSSAMGALLWWAFFRKAGPAGRILSLRSFLGVFWMSAPLAWLYGIPYERFLAPLAAFEANLWTLALVSLVRVAWVTRVITVLRGGRTLPSLVRVLACADAVVFVVAFASPRPVVEFMGGTRGSPLEEALGLTNSNLVFFSGLAFLPLLLGVWLLARRIPQPGELHTPPGRSTLGLTRFAGRSLGAWILLCVPAQLEERRAWSIERDLRAGRIRQALAELSTLRQTDLPPDWDPPPHPIFEEHEPPFEALLDSMMEHPVAPWVAQQIVPKAFHGYYSEDEGSDSVLQFRVWYWAEHLGTAVARARLEFIAAHGEGLQNEQRREIERLLVKIATAPDDLAPEWARTDPED